MLLGKGERGGGGDNCVRWYETWIQSSGCVSTKTFVWNAIQKEKKRKEEQFLRLSIRNPRLFFLRGRHTKLVAFTFQSWLLLWCVDLSVHGPKNESLFSCSCNTVDPHSSRKQSTFSSLSSSPPPSSSPSLPNTYPTRSAPLVLLPGVKWRHVFPCTCVERKEEKWSQISHPPSLPPCRGEQTDWRLAWNFH